MGRKLAKYDTYEIPAREVLVDFNFNCRGPFTLSSVQELAESIRVEGLEFPIVVEPLQEAGEKKYRLLAGFRRFTAMTGVLGWESVPATIRRGLSEEQARRLNFVENVERKQLNPLEEALWLGTHYPDSTSVSYRQMARDVGRDVRWVRQRMAVLRLPPTLQRKVAAATLSLLDVESLDKCSSDEEKIRLASEFISARKERRPLDRSARRFRPRKSKKQIQDMIAHLYDNGINDLRVRLLAWAAGWITDEEIQQEVDEEIFKFYQHQKENWRPRGERKRSPKCQSSTSIRKPAASTRSSS